MLLPETPRNRLCRPLVLPRQGLRENKAKNIVFIGKTVVFSGSILRQESEKSIGKCAVLIDPVSPLARVPWCRGSEDHGRQRIALDELGRCAAIRRPVAQRTPERRRAKQFGLRPASGQRSGGRWGRNAATRRALDLRPQRVRGMLVETQPVPITTSALA
ncbi:hypothetical protein WKW80_29670 [Variovorax humicola]|uniref:Uncharacterized protein n=1 Tax=Variovorax humicola TaxID=1769758 RepID=A0ABU8W9S8_9BURK